MKKIFTLSLFTCLSVFFVNSQNFKTKLPQSQINASFANNDRWDTILSTSINYTLGSFTVKRSIPFGNKIYLFGDSVLSYGDSKTCSFIKCFDVVTKTFSAINYNRAILDSGFSAVALVTGTSSTNGTFYFAPKTNLNNYPYYSNVAVLYHFNTGNNSVITETFSTNSYYTNGVVNMMAFSPSSSNDSITLFVDIFKGFSYDSTLVVRNKINTIGGFSYPNVIIPNSPYGNYTKGNRPFSTGTVAIVGFDANMFTSTDGINFLVNPTYSTTVGLSENNPYLMDTCKNTLYFYCQGDMSLYGGVSSNLSSNWTGNIGYAGMNISDFKTYKNKIWQSQCAGSNNGININYYELNGVSSITSTPSTTLGNIYFSNNSFPNFCRIKDTLYLAASAINTGDYSTLFNVWKLVTPTASISISSNTLGTNYACVGSGLSLPTLVNNSLNADSIRWIDYNTLPVNYSASSVTPGYTLPSTYSVAGASYTFGLIAIKGTLSDTAIMVVNTYSFGASFATPTPTSMCNYTPYTFSITTNSSSIIGVPSITSFSPLPYSPAYCTTSFTALKATLTPTLIGGPDNVFIQVTDKQGCTISLTSSSFSVFPSKLITGVASVSTMATPATGTVTLYKFQPMFTMFDSIASQVTDASGAYTFAAVPALNYLLKLTPSASSLQIAYTPSAVSWLSASNFTHGCVANTVQNVTVTPYISLAPGSGYLSGTVYEGLGYGQKTIFGNNSIMTPGNPIKGAVIKAGKNPGGDIATQARTNSSGQYTINNLPPNNPGESYFLLVDITGLDTNGTYHRVITTGTLGYSSLDFVVDSAKITPNSTTGLQQVKLNNESVLTIYPNPSTGLAIVKLATPNIKYNSFSISVYDLIGKRQAYIQKEQMNFVDEDKVLLNLQSLPNGIYIVELEQDSYRAKVKLSVQK
ncbi:MAG: T9SS type A sorting domain-containing protein [Bacteroidetes bacterium]|nr:T9SS type A sorting domain-containing protein [Bacteroidota bacterium]